MRVAIILPHFKAFGGVRRFLEVGAVLAQRGYDVMYYTPTGQPPPTWFEGYGAWFQHTALGHYYQGTTDICLVGDPPSFPKLSQITAKQVYVWVIAGGKYTQMYKDLKYQHAKLVNNRSFMQDFPDARLCEGGVNTNHFRPEDRSGFRVGYYAGRGDCKGETHIQKALANLPGIEPYPIQGLERDKLKFAYQGLSFFVAWEQRPGWSNTAAEALACGVPVVTNGVNCEPFLDRCIVVNDLRAFFAKIARQDMTPWNWGRTVDRLEEIWTEDSLL